MSKPTTDELRQKLEVLNGRKKIERIKYAGWLGSIAVVIGTAELCLPNDEQGIITKLGLFIAAGRSLVQLNRAVERDMYRSKIKQAEQDEGLRELLPRIRGNYDINDGMKQVVLRHILDVDEMKQNRQPANGGLLSFVFADLALKRFVERKEFSSTETSFSHMLSFIAGHTMQYEHECAPTIALLDAYLPIDDQDHVTPPDFNGKKTWRSYINKLAVDRTMQEQFIELGGGYDFDFQGA